MSKTSQPAANLSSRLRRVEGRHNSLVKQLRQAFSSGKLTDSGDCAIEGPRIVEEAIRSRLRFSALFFRESSRDTADRLLPQIGAQVETLLLPDKLFDSVVPTESPQGVAAMVRPKEFAFRDLIERLQVGPILVLSGLQDPGNVGTILRSAEAFASAGVILGDGTVSPYNAKAVRASAGSVFRLPVIHRYGNQQKTAMELASICQTLRAEHVRMIATSSHKGTPLHEAKLTVPCAIFLGNEGSGMPRNLITKMDETVSIPHIPQVESLNAGVAASIVLYEAARQRNSSHLVAPTKAPN
jgi:RNA methyltransferase, TrmH family